MVLPGRSDPNTTPTTPTRSLLSTPTPTPTRRARPPAPFPRRARPPAPFPHRSTRLRHSSCTTKGGSYAPRRCPRRTWPSTSARAVLSTSTRAVLSASPRAGSNCYRSPPPFELNASAVVSTAAAAAAGTRAVVGAVSGAVVGAPSFWLVDHSTGRMLYWADAVVRVRPLVRDPNLGWRLRRLSDDACPHWASAGLRRNQTSREWARRLVHTARGECAGECPTSALVGQVMV